MNNKIVKKIKGLLIAIMIPVIAFLICKIIAPDNIHLRLIPTNVIQAIGPAILAYGVVYETKVGIWDFSVGANIAVSSILAGHFVLATNTGIPGLLIACLVISTLIGTCVGVMFIKLRIPSIIVTVGVMLILESVTKLAFESKGVTLDKSIMIIGQFPYNIICLFTAVLICYVLYNKHSFGFQVRATGNGMSVAKQNGININTVRIKAFMITGFFCGVYAFYNFGRTYKVSPVSNMSSMSPVFSAIICAFIASALEKQCNLVIGIFVGALVARIISIMVMVLNLNATFADVFTAMILLGILAVQSNQDVIAKWKRKFSQKQKAVA